ncbi:MAG: hypothetical protein WC205_06945 [Opitutaceae bacterium]
MNKTLLLASLLIPASAAFAQSLINETFSDGNRSTVTRVDGSTGTYTSLDWWSNNYTAYNALTVANQSMTINTYVNTASAARHAVAHFDPVSLTTVGQSLTLSFNASFTGITTTSTSSNAFRFGLFNNAVTNGVYYTADNQNSATGAQGYSVRLSPYTSVAEISSRTGSPTNALLTSVGPIDNLTNLDFSGTIPSLLNDRAYSMSMKLTLETTTQVRVTYSILDTSSPETTSYVSSYLMPATRLYTTFDTIGFSAYDTSANPGVDTATLSNIQLTLTAIPEPATFAILANLAVLCLATAARRARASRYGA